MFIGIVDTPANNASNSLTLNIGSNINATKTDLNIHSNRNIIYNISNSHNINITSNNNYIINALSDKTTTIQGNLEESIDGNNE